ncbi:cytochrome P450 4d8 [Manduca sexta]|uniref:cytochrome P450 4d8 n=1 Tax=Manduca sexta TaxID=7130 RepID=UPI0011824FD7|nr:cytochrome P450 4d8 [Manduca sexta]
MIFNILFVLVLSYLFLRFKDRKLYKLSRQLNNDLLTIPFIGHLYLFIGTAEARMKVVIYLGRKALNNGGLCALWLGTKLFTVVADPVTFEYLSKTCLEKDDLTNVTQPLIGNGTIFAPVSIWRRRRKIVAFHFGLAKLNSFVDIFSKQSRVMVKKLKKLEGKETISVHNFFKMYSMDSVCETILGVKLCAQNECDHPFSKAFEENCIIFLKKALEPYIYEAPFYKLTSSYGTFMRNNAIIRDFVKKIIKSKREEHENEKKNITNYDERIENQKAQTFMDIMIKTSGSENGLSDEELIEESIVLLIAATDTSATAAAFVTLMLSRHLHVQDKVYKELQNVFNDTDRPVTPKDLTQLNYLEAVIKETLRLYPPAPLTIRKIDKDVTIPSGLTLVKGSSFAIHMWAINRNPQYWGQDADEFKPERFINGAPLHPAAFSTFSFGPRNCIGYKYAILSMKTVIANLLRNFQLLPAEASNLCTNSSKCLEKENQLRLKYEVMIRDVGDFNIRLKSRVSNS